MKRKGFKGILLLLSMLFALTGCSVSEATQHGMAVDTIQAEDVLLRVDFLDAGAAARTYILLFDVADDGAETGLAVFLAVQFSQQLSHVSLTVVVGSLGIAGTVNARGTI